MAWRLEAAHTFYVAERFFKVLSAQRRKRRYRSSSGLCLHFLCVCSELTFFFTWRSPTPVCSCVLARAEICLPLHPLTYSAAFALIKNSPRDSSSAPPRKNLYLPARRDQCYLILTYCSYWIHAPRSITFRDMEQADNDVFIICPKADKKKKKKKKNGAARLHYHHAFLFRTRW